MLLISNALYDHAHTEDLFNQHEINPSSWRSGVEMHMVMKWRAVPILCWCDLTYLVHQPLCILFPYSLRRLGQFILSMPATLDVVQRLGDAWKHENDCAMQIDNEWSPPDSLHAESISRTAAAHTSLKPPSIVPLSSWNRVSPRACFGVDHGDRNMLPLRSESLIYRIGGILLNQKRSRPHATVFKGSIVNLDSTRSSRLLFVYTGGGDDNMVHL